MSIQTKSITPPSANAATNQSLLEPLGASSDSHIFAVGQSLNNIKISIAATAIVPTIPISITPRVERSIHEAL